MAVLCVVLGCQILGFAGTLGVDGHVDVAQFDALVQYFGSRSLILVAVFASFMFLLEFLHNCVSSTASPLWTLLNEPCCVTRVNPVCPEVVPI